MMNAWTFGCTNVERSSTALFDSHRYPFCKPQRSTANGHSILAESTYTEKGMTGTKVVTQPQDLNVTLEHQTQLFAYADTLLPSEPAYCPYVVVSLTSLRFCSASTTANTMTANPKMNIGIRFHLHAFMRSK